MEDRGLLVSSAHNRYCCVRCEGMELVWQWVCLCRYTKRFDGVDLEKIVERVCDLPDPVVRNFSSAVICPLWTLCFNYGF
jgi:hypothetical protein